MDEFDKASEIEQSQRDMAISIIRNKRKASFTGFCRYCNAQINIGNFCSAECREDQELEDKLVKIKGF
jgi:hypothetical protein